VLDSYRLAYQSTTTVNWCPKLGTVLANDEVIDGKSERGGFPVLRKPLKQWMFRITAYADRLVQQLEGLDWPASTKAMQREWIGRSEGAEVDFAVLGTPTLRVGRTTTELIRELVIKDPSTLAPTEFVARDPYPPGTFGATDGLLRNERNLPHLELPHATYFVTWKCAGDRKLSEEDQTAVLSALTHFDGVRCRVFAACVMNNHVHWLVKPFEGESLANLCESVKHFAAKEVNERQGSHGRLWDPEAFDHIIRDSAYLAKCVRYIVNNPVEAGVVRSAESYAWTFVHPSLLSYPPHAERGGTQLRVFTTRPDTLYGATYMVVAPEHALCSRILKGELGVDSATRDALEKYVAWARNRSDVERQESKEKTGAFTGLFAINPVNNQRIPIWTSDYVMMGYGTGAIMAVPAHDDRDFEFATKFSLPIVRVVQPPTSASSSASKPEECFSGDGVAINSGDLNGLSTSEAKQRIIAQLEKQGVGKRRVNYRLRDWTFSRQRYWGEPFPIVYDDAGNAYPINESHLPVKLPELADYAPVESDDPQPLLAKAKDWVRTTAGAAGVDSSLLAPSTPVTRETNTMPGSAGSSWYAIRYCDPHNAQRLVSPQVEKYWMGDQGVDLYLGGSEHAVGHLLYSRFWQNVLFDLGHVACREPFHKLFHQGLITSFAYQRSDKSIVPVDEVKEVSEGQYIEIATGNAVSPIVTKMSKRYKNVVNPDDVIAEFGADTCRLYEMYMGPLEASKPWNPRDIVGCYRFLQRAWRVCVDETTGNPKLGTTTNADTEKLLHRLIKKVGSDIESMGFNTAIAAMIEFVNAATTAASGGSQLTRSQVERFMLVLQPFAPHLAQEVWQRVGNTSMIALAGWPAFDESMLVDSEIELPVSINGKVRTRIMVPLDTAKEPKTLEAFALAHADVVSAIAGKPIKKIIAVPNKMINVVVG
jgi:leucyl-tRNA synthetase